MPPQRVVKLEDRWQRSEERWSVDRGGDDVTFRKDEYGKDWFGNSFKGNEGFGGILYFWRLEKHIWVLSATKIPGALRMDWKRSPPLTTISPAGLLRPPGEVGAGFFSCRSYRKWRIPSREERPASLGSPEPASEQWRDLRTLALPPHGAAPGAAAGRGRALGDAGAAGHRRLRECLPVPTSGEAGRARERRCVFVRAPVEHSDCQYVRDWWWDLGQYCGPVSVYVCVCVCVRERERTSCVCEPGVWVRGCTRGPGQCVWGRAIMGNFCYDCQNVTKCLLSVTVRMCPSECRVRVCKADAHRCVLWA